MSKTINLGRVTAYADAVAAGYTGTREQFANDLANAANYAAEAGDAAETATEAATTASTAAETATDKAEEASADAEQAHADAQAILVAKETAVAAANTASSKAGEAANSAQQAAASETAAAGSATTASNAATSATASKNAAAASETNAANSASQASQTLTNVNQAGATQVAAIQAKGTEVLNSIPADYTELSNDVDDLKSDLNAVKEVTVTEESETVTENIFPSLTWTDNKYMALNGTVYSGAGYRYSNKISVSAGNVFAFANQNFGFGWICAFNGDTAVSELGQQGRNSYTVPQGIDGIVITENISRGEAAINWTHEVISYVNILSERMGVAESHINDIQTSLTPSEYIDNVPVDTVPVFTTGAIDQNGNVYSSSDYQSFQYTQKIPITSGATIETLNALGNKVGMRWICAYNGSTAVPASGTNTNPTSFTVNGNIDSVVVTCAIASAAVVVKVTTPTEKTAYFANAKPIPIGFMTNNGALSDGDALYLPKTNVKNENVLLFNANITTFDSVKIGKQSNTYVVVDDTNITLHNTGNPDTYIIPHGLTIGHNITVMIQTESSLDASLIRVSSDGVTFDYTTPARRFVMDDGTPYAISVGSTFTECVFVWTSRNISAPIWIFGDSYLSYWDTNWTKFLIDDGYVKNCMLNGFAGESSARDYESLVNLLAITTPKIVVWCLGMNDPDTDSAVNASWKTYYDKVVNLQKEYGFELVLYTVPTTPTMNNKFKDAIVRESGYRYVEADKAVRINDNGDWITGALLSDNVHPSAIGGNIIYNRILADLPEIMVNW